MVNPRNCVGCTFQIREGGRQIGCQNPFFDLEAVDAQEIEGDIWFTNTACQYKRPENWRTELSLEQKIIKSREEATISWTLCYTPQGLPVNSELKACERFLESEIPPTKVICHVDNFDAELVRSFPEIEFLITPQEQFVDFISQHHADHLFCISKHPKQIKEDFFVRLDKAVNEEERFSFQILENSQMEVFSGRLWQRGLYPQVYLEQARSSGEMVFYIDPQTGELSQ